MQLWTWTLLALLGLCGAQRIAQDDAETVLELAASVKEDILNRLRQEDTYNASCILEGIRDRKINVLQLHRLSQSNGLHHISERLCGLQDQWLTDIHYIQEELNENTLSRLTVRQKQAIDLTCGSFPDAVTSSLMKGDLAATKKLIIGLLSTLRYPIVTPDVITLFENAVKIIQQSKVTVESFRITGDDVVENLLLGVLSQNDLYPHENYQILELISTLDNLRPLKEMNLLLLIKPDSYPRDVIEARDKLIIGIGYGAITGEPSLGWPTPPQQLLSLLTSLTANPNDNEYVPYAHVLFGYFRLRYLTLMGYEFVPRSIADIAFLLNSFLTIRHPILIREVYFEFAKIHWQSYVSDIDYTQYSDPRVLFIDMVKAILRHPEGLKLCNKLIFHYFLNADSCPDWLQVLPPDSEQPRPVEVLPGVIPKPPPPLSKCPGEDVPVIDPECIIEIMASNTHANFIVDIIRFHPGTAERYPYNTREAVYQAILNDLKTGKYKDDEVNQFVISQAINRLPLNDNKTLPPIYISMCPNDITELNGHEPTPPVTEESSTSHYKTTDLGSDTEGTSTETDCEDPCKKVSVVEQDCLINIISETRTNTIKNIVLLKPVFYEHYKHLDTREQILKKVLSDRQTELQDEIISFIIPQAIERMKISWEGTLPPVIEEVCEDDLKYNVTIPELDDEDTDNEPLPTRPTGCAHVKTIDATCLIEILSDIKHTKSVQKLLLEEPIIASHYEQYSTRSGVLKAVVISRCEKKGEWQLTYDVKKILAKVPFNWKHALPLEYIDDCPTTEQPGSHISPTDIFNNTIPGLGENPVPCSSTTEMPSQAVEDTDRPNSTEEEPATHAPPINEEEELEDCDDEGASAVGVGVSEIGENPSESGQTLGDQLLDSILGAVSLHKPHKKKCRPKKTCPKGEIMTDVVKIESLWDALTQESPRAPYIRSKVLAFMVPIDRNKEYTKAEVLKDILLSVREDVRDIRVLQNVDNLIKCIRFEGPGIEPPGIERVCLQDNLVSPPTTESPKPNCQRGQILVTVVQTDSLYAALKPSAPKTPYIRNRINSYIVPVDRSKIYTKGEVLRDILLSLKEDIKEERVLHNIDILLAYIRTDGSALDTPEMADVCVLESALDDSHISPTEAPTEPQSTSSPHHTTTPSHNLPITSHSSNGDSLGTDYPINPGHHVTPAPYPTTTETNSEETDGPTTPGDDTTSTSYESTERPSEETITPPNDTSPQTTPSPANNPEGELEKLCPCPIDSALMKIIEITSITNLLTDERLSARLSGVVLPTSKYINKNRRQVLEAILTELMLREHEVHAAMISCTDDGLDAPTIKYACVPTQHAYEVPQDVLICPTKEAEPPIISHGQCPCPAGQQYLQVVNNLNIIEILSPTDSHLRYRLASLVMPVAKYANNDKKRALENALREIMLRDYETSGVLHRCGEVSEEMPQIITACVPSEYADLFPMDLIGCPEPTTTIRTPESTSCHRPIDVLVPSSLLEAIYPHALDNAVDMVNIILNSSLEHIKYEHLGNRAKIVQELLREMREICTSKIELMGTNNQGNIMKVKQWIQQLDELSSGIRYEGIGTEPPRTINTCVIRPVDCDSLLCELKTMAPTEDYDQLQNALMRAAQAPNTTPSSTGKRKVKKTHIIYTTKETINVNIQATKPTNQESSVAEDVSKITNIMQEERNNSDARIAEHVGQALNITGKIVQQ